MGAGIGSQKTIPKKTLELSPITPHEETRREAWVEATTTGYVDAANRRAAERGAAVVVCLLILPHQWEGLNRKAAGEAPPRAHSFFYSYSDQQQWRGNWQRQLMMQRC